jgi:hypothetical protein
LWCVKWLFSFVFDRCSVIGAAVFYLVPDFGIMVFL